MTPELAHLIRDPQEQADQLLKGQYEVVITTHLKTLKTLSFVWNSVTIADGISTPLFSKSYYAGDPEDFR